MTPQDRGPSLHHQAQSFCVPGDVTPHSFRKFLDFSVLTEVVASLDFCFVDPLQHPALCLLGCFEIHSPPAFSSNPTPLLWVGKRELMSLWTTWQVTFEMARIPLILLFLRKGQIIGEKNFRWGAILRVYKTAHFVDKIWTVWKIYKSLKILRSLQNLKQQETSVIFLKQVFIKVIGCSWCGRRKK